MPLSLSLRSLLATASLLLSTLASPILIERSVKDNTVYYNLELTKGIIAPDGYSREAILINGITPGPTLEINEGQTISVTVHNNLDEVTTLHFHGIYHAGNPWYDGVPGVTQYPIPIGANFTYEFTPEGQYGLYWYHSHYKSHITDGLRGAFLIHPAPSRARPFKKYITTDATELAQLKAAEAKPEILMLTDWAKNTSAETNALYLASGANPLCVNSFLINGKGQSYCPPQSVLDAAAFPFILPVSPRGCVYPNSSILTLSTGANYTVVNPFFEGLDALFIDCANSSTPLEVTEVSADVGYISIDAVFGGSLYEKKLSIDGHKFLIYAVDGQYVEPQEVDVLVGAIGERYQAFVKLDNPGNWTIRLANQDYSSEVISGYGIFSYVDKPKKESTQVWTDIPSTPLASQYLDYGGNLINNATVLDDFTLKPYPAVPPPQTADHTLVWDIGQPDPRVWVLDGVAYLPWRSDDTPALFNPQISLDAGVAASVPNGTVIDIIFALPPGNPVHPMHKHDTKAWVIGIGYTAWNYTNVAEAIAESPELFNLVDPPLRDTYRTPLAIEASGWLAIRYTSDNPGPVFVHCHIDNHLQAGMAFLLLQGLEVGFPQAPAEFTDIPHTIVSSNPTPTLVDGYTYAGGV